MIPLERLDAIIKHRQKRVDRATQKLAEARTEHEDAEASLASALDGRAAFLLANPEYVK